MEQPMDRRQIETPFERTSGGVAYRSIGSNLSIDREPLVLLHGGAGSWEHWVLNVDSLATRFCVLAVDLPCYGDSEALPWETPVADYLAATEAAIREMTRGQARVHLAGFSFGGFIAADMAVRLGALSASLSMTGGAGYGKPEGRGFTLDSRRRMAERLGRPPRDEELRAMHRDNLGKLMLWDQTKIDDWAIDMQTKNVARTRFDSRRLSWAEGTPERLAQLSCPAAVIYGDHDAAAVPPIAERFRLCRTARPDVRTELIPDCGHWAMYEAPETVNALLLDFHGGASCAP
ncbi:MAG: alpha/beta fold hydrolase [Paracoccaceae bacterium]